MTASGMRVTPQASSFGECGIIRNPTCFPAPSRSTVVKAEDGRTAAGFPIGASDRRRPQRRLEERRRERLRGRLEQALALVAACRAGFADDAVRRAGAELAPAIDAGVDAGDRGGAPARARRGIAR